MRSIAIIGEGISDQVVLENILIGIFDDPNLNIRMEQPTLDSSDAHRLSGAGGWTEVFRFCGSDLFANVFAVNEFVVIQIDTDCCGEVGYGVKLPQIDNRVDVEQLITDVSARICDEIDESVLEQVRERIVFAICVDSIECWLLPLVRAQSAHVSKITGCLEAVNRGLNKSNAGFYLDAKNPEYYDTLSRPYKKRKTITKASRQNPSLGIFVDAVGENIGMD